METKVHTVGTDRDHVMTTETHAGETVSVQPIDVEERLCMPDPRTAAFLAKLEKDPVITRRLWATGLVGTALGLSALQVRKLFTTQKPANANDAAEPFKAEQPLASAEPEVPEQATSNVEPIARESVWDRKPGKITKGETVYVPYKNARGKTDYMSLRFVDEGRRKTLLFVDGEPCEQTADGFPIRITDIEILEGGKIAISGVAMLVPGTSVWTAKEMDDMNFALKDKGRYTFAITSLIKTSEGVIRTMNQDASVSDEQ